MSHITNLHSFITSESACQKIYRVNHLHPESQGSFELNVFQHFVMLTSAFVDKIQ